MPFISSTDGDLKSAFVTDAWLIDQFVGNKLFAWGSGSTGALGNNSTTDRSSPSQVITNANNWKMISCGYYHTGGIKVDGSLWTWGTNLNGRLGNNNFLNTSSPAQTASATNDWASISCGFIGTAAIKTDGTLWCWGSNNSGQLGDNTIVHRSSPVQTVTYNNNWKQVSMGFQHTAGLKIDGTLWMWGNNTGGQLGDNTTINRSSPVQVLGSATNWNQVSCGKFHTCAIKTDGTLWGWGSTPYGELGNNQTATLQYSSPIQTISSGTNWKYVSAGYQTTAAIKTDGTLWLWGRGSEGQIGNNAVASVSSPVQTICAGNNWKYVNVFKSSSAIKTDGSLWRWGRNYFGDLGDNTTIAQSSPIQTILGGYNWKQIATGYYHVAAVTYGD